MTGNLEYYKVFYYTAKNSSLTMAAAELSVSQPAVSQALKQLEAALGVKLFVRSAKGIRLNLSAAKTKKCMKRLRPSRSLQPYCSFPGNRRGNILSGCLRQQICELAHRT